MEFDEVDWHWQSDDEDEGMNLMRQWRCCYPFLTFECPIKVKSIKNSNCGIYGEKKF